MKPFQSRLPHGHGIAGPQQCRPDEQGVTDVLSRSDGAASTPNDAEDTSNNQSEPDPLGNGEGFAKYDSGQDRNKYTWRSTTSLRKAFAETCRCCRPEASHLKLAFFGIHLIQPRRSARLPVTREPEACKISLKA